MARLKEQYKAEVAPALYKKFGYKSTMQIPKIDKVVVNVGCGEAKENAKVLEAVVRDRRGLTVLVRNALFSRVRMAAHRDAAGLGEADGDWGFGERAWMQALDEYYEAHEEILLDADARSKAYLMFDEADEEELHVWHVRQIFHDEAGDNDFVIVADVDLDATQEGDGVVFANYRVGFADELLAEF